MSNKQFVGQLFLTFLGFILVPGFFIHSFFTGNLHGVVFFGIILLLIYMPKNLHYND